MASLLVINVVVEVFLQMTLCYVLQQDPNLRKLLKFTSKWARNNEMQFGINKCASLVVREEVSRFLYNSNPTFFIYYYIHIGQIIFNYFINSMFFLFFIKIKSIHVFYIRINL